MDSNEPPYDDDGVMPINKSLPDLGVVLRLRHRTETLKKQIHRVALDEAERSLRAMLGPNKKTGHRPVSLLISCEGRATAASWRRRSRVPLRSVAKFNQKTDQPNSNGQHADGGQEPGCCRARAGDNPDSTGTDDAERNDRVAHAVAPWTAEDFRTKLVPRALS